MSRFRCLLCGGDWQPAADVERAWAHHWTIHHQRERTPK